MLAIRPFPRLLPLLRTSKQNLRPFSAQAADRSSRTQVYISKSRSPYVNLSIEHHLLQTTPPDSTILFLYTNRPAVVIGRNQNPWLEVNLPLLQKHRNDADEHDVVGVVDLVRRRSGGGTVFHDEGNVNYSVICPPANFDRDTHAEMVVRALRSLGAEGVSVNCRHDIVMTLPPLSSSSSSATRETPNFDSNLVADNITTAAASCRSTTTKLKVNAPNTYKISGSAYKLTRLRSLHHGTCLLSSPNLARIGPFLRSPAEPFIKARGVESVRSRIRNVGIADTREFMDAVVVEFGRMYGDFDVRAELGEGEEVEAGQAESVKKGIKELESREWIYGQTPLFTFSTHPSEEDTRERPELPHKFKLTFEARHGLIQKFDLDGLRSAAQAHGLSEALLNAQLWEMGDWTQRLRAGGLDLEDASIVGEWLNSLLGKTQA